MPEMNIVQAVNDASAARDAPRPARRRAGRGRRQVRRRVPRHQRALHDEFGADRVHRHAARRRRHRRHRDRHGALRPAPGARDPVRRLHLPGLRPDRERAGQVPLPLGRRVSRPVVDPHAGRRRHPRRPLPLAVARGALHPHRPASRWSARRTRYDAKGLLAGAIRDDDPVLFFEPKRVYRAAKGEVPEGDYTIPLGKAKVVREGSAGHRHRLGRDAARRRSRPPSRARAGASTWR